MPRVITTYDELLEWSRRANFCTNNKGICQLQDEFGMSDAKVIDFLWRQSVRTGDRNLVCFALHKVMGDDYLARYIDVWIRTKIEEWKELLEKEYMDKYHKIGMREIDLSVAKKAVSKRVRYAQRIMRDRDNKIANLRQEIRNLMDDNKKLHNSLSGAFDQACKYEHFAERYFDMLGMLNTIKDDMIQKEMGLLK